MKNSPNRLLGVIFGIVYLLVGLIGFFYTNGVAFASTVVADNKVLGLFAVNPLHNVVHLLVGAILLIAGLRSVWAAKRANTTIGVIYLLLGIVGLFILDSDVNILAINGWDNGLHLVSAVLLLVVGLGADRDHSPQETRVNA